MRLEVALGCAVRGWAVFPLVPNTKTPMTRNGFKDATVAEDKVRQWWSSSPSANIGIATGAVSRLIVIDVDVKNGAKGRESLQVLKGLPPTLTVKTPSGGWHLYYSHPSSAQSRNNVLPGIDMKADGGYVVAAGSSIDGKPYEWVDPETPVAPIKLEGFPLLVQRRRDTSQDILAGPKIAEGKRNVTFARIAGYLRRLGMDSFEIHHVLLILNARRCDPPLSEIEVEGIARSISRYSVGKQIG